MGYRVLLCLSLAIVCAGQERLSDWYVESLKGLMEWGDPEIAQRQAALRKNPHDLRARLQLMAYSARGDQARQPGSTAKRLAHAMWLIEHAPGSEILHSPYARFRREDLGEEGIARSVALWRAAKGNPGAIAWNAATFFEGIDTQERWKYLEATVRLAPDNASAIRVFADECALAIQAGGSRRREAENVLAASKNSWLLGNVAHQMFLRGVAGSEEYFARAKAIDPKLERSAIFPSRVAAQTKEQVQPGDIRRREIGAFRNLPPRIAEHLKRLGCKVPQIGQEPQLRNVIQGEFFTAGESGWAALCSTKGKSSILAFRNSEDSNPAVLALRDDEHYMQGMGGNSYEYSRQISAAIKDSILRHYRAYGGPKPPTINHHGIDDAFLGKASCIWYFHEGKWLRLQGAD